MLDSLVASGMLATYIAAETASLTAEKLTLYDPQLPVEFDGLKIAFASDIHHGPFCGVRRIQKMNEKIRIFQPDLILHGGDYFQSLMPVKQYPKYFASLSRELQDLVAPLGVYGVLGNHDHTMEVDKIKTVLNKAGVKLLDNKGVWLKKDNAKIRLGGVGDLWFDKQDLKKAKGDKKMDDYMILLSHQPNYLDKITDEDGVNLVLAGHTHGGQFTLFNYLPMDFHGNRAFKWKYRSGLIANERIKMLVSPGVGNSAPYIRFFAPPKIHLITLRSGSEL